MFTGENHYLKSPRRHFHPNFPLSQIKLNQKTSLFVRCKILALFCNTLTAATIYSRHSADKFLRHVQTPLSTKPSKFSVISIVFLQSRQNLVPFEKIDQLHSQIILELIDSEKYGYLNLQNRPF